MASNAASSVQFRVNGTEMARGRTRKTERSQSMDPRAKPRAAGRLKGKRRDNRNEREFILGPENAGNFCIARRSRGISAIVSRRLPRRGLLGSQRVAPQQRRFASGIYLPTKPRHNNRNGTCLSGDVQISAIGQLLGEAAVWHIASCSPPFFAQSDPAGRVMSNTHPENDLAHFG